MSIEGQGHFFTIYFPGFVCFVLYWAKISGECLQDHWSSGMVKTLQKSSPEPETTKVKFGDLGFSMGKSENIGLFRNNCSL